MPQVLERFQLDQLSAGVTALDGLGASWAADIWDFNVPINQDIVIQPGDVFSCYLIGDDAAEMPANTKVRVLLRDVSNEESTPLLPPLPYQQLKAFTDKKKLMRLRIHKEIRVENGMHIVVQVNGLDATGVAGDTDASASSFKLVCHRRRKSV